VEERRFKRRVKMRKENWASAPVLNSECLMDQFKKLIEAATHGNLAEVKAIAERHPELVNQRDPIGATALHYAAFGGHCDVVRALVECRADLNVTDSKFGGTPAGWAIEYIREMGGFLGIELADFAHAIRRGDLEWATRFLRRFPKLRDASDTEGKPFRQLARESGNAQIAKLFD